MKKYFILIIIPILLFSCIKREPIQQESQFETDFNTKKEILESCNNDFFEKLETSNLDSLEYKYLKYLITYLPLSDYADYEFDFFRNLVSYSIKAQNTFSWAKEVPEEIFLHYVLPTRVNNENLDTSRIYIYNVLKERFANMELSNEDAILEVNHWCHEKVDYRPTDGRTISPLGAIRRAYGRCGEESTFLVTALRAIGIPARQVYTPRWAHTDDNHAWVEAWSNGQWYYMGACEPSPVLNTGWFNVPASRAMLVHTKEFGNIEEANDLFLGKSTNYNWMNTLKTYAPTKTVVVTVKDEQNNPIKDAEVEFKLYNYAEMYPLYTANTDDQGLAKFETGYGSIDIFVSKNGKFISKNLPGYELDTVNIVLGEENVYPEIDILYVPPIAGAEKEIDPDLEKTNNIRIEEENKIRANYEKTFYDKKKAKSFLNSFSYPENLAEFLIESRGNWAEIEQFLMESHTKNLKVQAAQLLSQISQKDLCDTRSEILSEHLKYALEMKSDKTPQEIFEKYVLSPRVQTENLVAYRKHILETLDNETISKFQNNPELISDYISDNIKTEITNSRGTFKGKDLNDYNASLTPLGVQKLKFADEKSYLIYYVAFCRTLAIPARIDATTNTVQVYYNDIWNDVILFKDTNDKIIRTKLILENSDPTRDIKYRIQFAIAKIENGKINTVEIEWDTPISELSDGIELPIGEYMLLTSTRSADGSILVNRKYFNLKEGFTKTMLVELPKQKQDTGILKVFNHSNIFDKSQNKFYSADLLKDKFTVFCWLDPAKEPSKHIVRDLSPMLTELKNNNIDLVFFVDSDEFIPSKYGFPDDINYYIDKNHELLTKNINCSIGGNTINLPEIMMLNKENKIVFSSKGYIIAVGEMLLNKIK